MLKDDLEQDIYKFFREADNMTLQDKKDLLLILFDKYLHLNSASIKFDKMDFNQITSIAKRDYVDRAWPKKIKGGFDSLISNGDAANLCVMEATIGYLKSKDCLRKIPQFDYDVDWELKGE